MRTSIKINDQYIQKILLGSTPVQRIYQSGSIVYEAGGSTPCFEVVNTISEASGDYVDVYAWDTEKWYKRNNLSQYEEYGVMPKVSDLSSITYYTGKLVVLDTNNHEYKWNGSSWTDLGEISDVYTEYEYVQGNGTSYVYTDYIPVTNSRAEIDIQGRLASSASVTTGEASVFGSIHLINGAGSKRFTFMYPGYNTDGVAGGIRLELEAQQLASHDNAILSRGVVKIDKDHAYLNDKLLATFNGSFTGNQGRVMIFTRNSYDPTTGTVTPAGLPYPGKIYNVKIYEGDTLVRNYVPATKDGIVGFYETVNHVMWGSYVSTPFTVGGSSSEQGNVPEDYPTKVAPANNVHYNTLAELELMECPWNGMQATVGQDYELYLYWNNQWNKLGMPCFEVVSTISKASGDYVDVYVKGESKWYKRNNLNQFEEYGLMPTVTDLSSTTYYTGKLVILSTDTHEYRWTGNEWEDLGSAGSITSYLFADPITSSTYSCQYSPKYYFDNNYKLQIFFYVTEGYSYSSDFSMLGSNGTSPIEFSWYSNGFYFDSHYPTSTAGQFNTGDYDNRVMANGQLNSHKGKLLLLEITFNKAVLYDYETGNQLYTSGSIVTKDFKDCGTVLRIIAILRMNANSPAHIGWLKVFDNNGDVVNDIRPALDTNNKLIWHDSIVNADYLSNNSNSFPYHYVSIGELDPPVDYDEKVAPADNVHYNTLEELELMECPWIGMTATVGQEYTSYVYTENGWILGDLPLDLPYLRFTALENTTFTFTKSGLKYSIDGRPWKDLEANTATPTVTSGSYILFKGSNLTPSSSEGIGTFSATGNFDITGNIMSLLFDDEFPNNTSLSGKDYAFYKLFFNCNKIKSIPSGLLPATTLSGNCYNYMFYNCTGIKSIPSGFLPATTLAGGCYRQMFYNCTGITSIPSGLLPATTLKDYCYNNMFNGCTGITSIPSGFLPATTLAAACYRNMFYGCTGITSIPSGLLPATTLAYNCYSEMFRQISTKSVPSDLLPATVLQEQCYNGMFSYCSNLEEPPILNITSTSSKCMAYMFNGCSKLKYLVCNMLTSPSSSITKNWLNGVSDTGTFYKNPNATWDQTITKGVDTVPTGWSINAMSEPEYIKFTTVDDNGSTYAFSKAGLEYSIDGGAWTTLAANTNTPNVPKNSNIRFRGYLTPDGTANGKLGLFSSSGRYNASGNICTLMYGDYYYGQTSKIKARTFQTLFQSSKIVDASALILPPVNGDYMYYAMFKDSKSLVTPPAINFTNAAYYGCSDMFYGCSSMTTVPSVTFGGERLNTGSLQRMFQACSSIVDASPIILNAKIAWDSLCDTFRGCSSLQTTPIIKGNISQNGASRTFDGCPNLTTITYLGKTTPNSSNSPGWLPSGCTATFYMNENATWDQSVTRDSNGVPAGCTIVKVDPNDY